ncbi:hypothetical protein OQA88_232 [Cercophora sp. LCS_1]
MAGKIECYVDIASLYSYLAFLEILRNRDILASHSIEVEFRPFLLGAINAGSGNKPPWTLPAKAVYGIFDADRAISRFPGLQIQFPKDLMSISLTVLPLRALHYIKRNYPEPAFFSTLHYLFHVFWSPPNIDLTKPENVVKALGEVTVGYSGGEPQGDKLFSQDEVWKILEAAGSKEMKDAMRSATEQALKQGAFGAPWLWVTNEEGKTEPFFGSDRFHFIFKFLGLPFQDIKLLPATESSKL